MYLTDTITTLSVSLSLSQLGILWNFRYPNSGRRRDDVAMIIHNSRLSISEWLNLLELQQYEGQFSQQFILFSSKLQ